MATYRFANDTRVEINNELGTHSQDFKAGDFVAEAEFDIKLLERLREQKLCILIEESTAPKTKKQTAPAVEETAISEEN